MFKSGAIIVFGNFAVSLVSLARNIVIARLISVEDFGVASAFALLFAIGETMSDIAVDRLIVQAKDGDDRRFQGTLHAIQAGRGLFSALIMFLLAAPYAHFMGVPDAVWAFQVFAIFPIFRGFAHLDIFRAQRAMRFGPYVLSTLAASVVSIAAVWPLAHAFGDYQVMLWALVLQQAAFLVASHLLAERGYRLGFDLAVAKRALSFGLPLLGNAMLLFCILNGDRLIVGNQLGMETLGWFAVAATLTLTPSLVLGKSLQSFFLPQLSAAQDDPARFDRLARATVEGGLLLGAVMAVAFALLGPAAVVLLFGAKYAAALDVVVWLGLMQAVRVGKAGLFVVAIAKGETTNLPIANFVRVAFLPIAFVAVAQGAPVVAVAWAALAGEVASYATSLARLSAKTGFRPAGAAAPVAATAVLLGLIAVDAVLWPPGAGFAADGAQAGVISALVQDVHVAQAGIVVFALVAGLLALPTLRGMALGWLRRRRASGPPPAGAAAKP